jgi:hypothetical protein
MHTHLLPDGSIVTHAHPFDRSGESESGESHQHSNLEFVLFQHLEILFFFAMISVGLKKISTGIKKFNFIPALHFSTIIFAKPGRAPPRM